MSKWRMKQIGEVIKFNPNERILKGSIAKKIPMDRLIPFQRKIIGYELAEYSSGPKFRNGDTLLAKITPCLENGKTAQVDILEENEVAFGSSEFIVLRETEDTVNDYIFYLAQSPAFRKKAIGCMEGTSGRKRVNEGALKLQELPIPDKTTQRQIADVLLSLDSKIELNAKINAELKAMTKKLYDYWFVQFDFPGKDGKPYKSSGGKMVYNDGLKREIPEGWKVGTFNGWIKETKSGDWGKDSNGGNYTERVFCVRGADINGINGNGDVKVPERFILRNNASKTLSPDDFIIEISGGSPTQSTGRIALLSDKVFERFDAPVICSNFCRAISLKDKKYIFNFQQEWQRLYDANVFFGFEGKTSGIKNFLFDSFINSYQVVFPEKEVAQKFYDFAKTLEIKKQTNLLQNQQLVILRDWLLPMLMNGQIKAAGNYISYISEEQTLSMAAEQEVVYRTSKQLPIPANKKGFAKQVLAGKIVSKFKNDPHFTDIKFQKIQFLAEHILEADLNLNYYYQAAGPYDNKFMHSIYDDFRKQKWFEYKKNKFVALEKQNKIEDYYQEYFSPAQVQLDELFDLLYNTSEAEAEIIATLYAVWNNRIILNQQVSDKVLIEDFYNWSDRKKQYSKEQVLNELQWLTANQMEPNGFGKIIKMAKSKK